MNVWLKIIQRLCFGVGAALIAVWAVAQVHREVGQRQDLEAFEAARRSMAAAQLAYSEGAADGGSQPTVSESVPSLDAPEVPTLPLAVDSAPAAADDIPLPPPRLPESLDYDYSLWSPKRVEDYRESLAVKMDAPQALLRIPSLDLQVPVLDGIDELTLNRGVGRIPGTVRPGGLGNIGIAGHRDGFFRALKDISVGDEIELVTWRERFLYQVTEIDIVGKDDVHVLTSSDDSMITLVTCYPFYFVGHAPKRYIVKALLAGSEII